MILLWNLVGNVFEIWRVRLLREKFRTLSLYFWTRKIDIGDLCLELWRLRSILNLAVFDVSVKCRYGVFYRE